MHNSIASTCGHVKFVSVAFPEAMRPPALPKQNEAQFFKQVKNISSIYIIQYLYRTNQITVVSKSRFHDVSTQNGGVSDYSDSELLPFLPLDWPVGQTNHRTPRPTSMFVIEIIVRHQYMPIMFSLTSKSDFSVKQLRASCYPQCGQYLRNTCQKEESSYIYRFQNFHRGRSCPILLSLKNHQLTHSWLRSSTLRRVVSHWIKINITIFYRQLPIHSFI